MEQLSRANRRHTQPIGYKLGLEPESKWTGSLLKMRHSLTPPPALAGIAVAQ